MANSFNNALMLNQAAFSAILQQLERGWKGETGQSHLIVGEHGSGKTTLLMRLYHEMLSSSNLQVVWLDGRKVFSSETIVKSISSKRTVVFLDDIQYYLQRTSSEQQYYLRGILSAKDGPILIATAPVVSSQLTSYGAAFYDAFRITYLKSLSNEELHSIIGESEPRFNRGCKLMKFLPKTIRAAIMVRDIMKRSHSSADDVRLLKESVSSLYRTRFDALPSQQQRILIALAGETEGLKLSGIREKTGQSASAISPYLTQMIENGIITRDSTSQRGGAYRISDLLLELWLQ